MKMDMYKHLNKDSKVEIGIEEIASQLDHMNFGVQRMLSAIARFRLNERPHDELGLGLKALLDKGLF